MSRHTPPIGWRPSIRMRWRYVNGERVDSTTEAILAERNNPHRPIGWAEHSRDHIEWLEHRESMRNDAWDAIEKGLMSMRGTGTDQAAARR